ncbi:efflux transporter periplasmic adaptor subunit [Pseudomonas fluorescens]|uniref:efflux RND transporter periplasmic adaptor subunit n=1 Tax=Pseudomonas fluorescens TaxID=294 RepID=UPI00083DBFF8|nr:efflux RND transporter periplasmic adaptor subunit [Pseudomonas fluorescens]AOE69793.1 efflux transporter periplasmic adaptor subunit [Pseudomonas fluorescens]AOE75637.1 efflux transporter periplasmic adaptor subunit [Pseudomonas fluorescens]
MPGRRMLAMLGVVLVVVSMLAGYKAFWINQQLARLNAPKPPASVSVAPVVTQLWQRQLPAAGSLKALKGIDLSIEVPGVVTQVHFESGQAVTAGQSLLQLENQMETAQRDIALANRSLARQNFERGQMLVDSQAISKGEFDRLSSEFNRHNALVKQYTAALEKKHITAPFSGTIGIRQVNIGDYLQSTAVIASLQDTSSLYVDFHVPEQAVQFIEVGQSVQVEVSARPGQHTLGLVSAINPIVDDSTRNVRVRATLPNPHNRLLPGMFASLQVQLAQPTPQVVVPEESISYSPAGQYVYVVSPHEAAPETAGTVLTAKQRPVETGERRNGQVIITRGLAPGEQVVTAGQLKLKHGAPVIVSADRNLSPHAPLFSGDNGAAP